LQTHNIQIHEVLGDYFVSLDVEVAGDLTLEEAHQRVSLFEGALLQELPYIKEINTHIEPVSSSSIPISVQDAEMQEDIQSQILELVEGTSRLRGCHNIHIWPENEGYDVVLHCISDPSLSIIEAHNLTEELEKQIYTQVSGIHQILIHMEPEE